MFSFIKYVPKSCFTSIVLPHSQILYNLYNRSYLSNNIIEQFSIDDNKYIISTILLENKNRNNLLHIIFNGKIKLNNIDYNINENTLININEKNPFIIKSLFDQKIIANKAPFNNNSKINDITINYSLIDLKKYYKPRILTIYNIMHNHFN
jgi:hypothetical protein